MTRRLTWIDIVLGAAASIILFMMMLLTFADVLMRYAFNAPIRGAFEVTELCLLVLIFAGMPLVSEADEHVTMDFIDRLLSPRVKRIFRRFVELVCAVIILGMAWMVWIKAGKIAAYGDTTDVMKIPVGPFVYFMTVMVAVTGLIHLIRVFRPAEEPPQSELPRGVTT